MMLVMMLMMVMMIVTVMTVTMGMARRVRMMLTTRMPMRLLL